MNTLEDKVKPKLTNKQEMFCLEYIKDFNATQSYKRAGYGVKNDATAGVQSNKLLKNPKITEYIEILKEERMKRLRVDADWVLREAVEVYKMAKGEIAHIKSTRKNGAWHKEDVFMTNVKEANNALNTIGKHVKVKAFEKIVDIGDSEVIVVGLPKAQESTNEKAQD